MPRNGIIEKCLYIQTVTARYFRCAHRRRRHWHRTVFTCSIVDYADYITIHCLALCVSLKQIRYLVGKQHFSWKESILCSGAIFLPDSVLFIYVLKHIIIFRLFGVCIPLKLKFFLNWWKNGRGCA